jgi:uncharacterized membrane protein
MAASFIKRLDELLRDATERGVVDANAAQTLLAMGRERERGRSVVGLAGVLGFLGGGSVIIGIILVIASNWDAIPDPMKIGGFVVLLAGVHGLAFYLRATGSEYTKTIESLHFIGGGLFLAGIGLVAQIYHLNARPPNGLLLWLIALVPLAITIGSAPLGLLTIFALFLWAHVEGDYYGSPLEMQGFASHLLLDVGLAVELLGFAPLLRKREPSLAWVMRACAVLVLFATIYTLGFFRYFAESSHRDGHYATMPLIALGLGGIGLAVGARTMAPEAPAYRDRIVLLLALVLLLGLAALGAAFERIPPGPA